MFCTLILYFCLFLFFLLFYFYFISLFLSYFYFIPFDTFHVSFSFPFFLLLLCFSLVNVFGVYQNQAKHSNPFFFVARDSLNLCSFFPLGFASLVKCAYPFSLSIYKKFKKKESFPIYFIALFLVSMIL